MNTVMLMQYQIDAFSHRVFSGNPAAVIPLDQWLPDSIMQAIAEENNLSETAFYIPAENSGTFHLRWFTPVAEVDLCGHATLATAHVLFHERGFQGNGTTFESGRPSRWLTCGGPDTICHGYKAGFRLDHWPYGATRCGGESCRSTVTQASRGFHVVAAALRVAPVIGRSYGATIKVGERGSEDACPAMHPNG